LPLDLNHGSGLVYGRERAPGAGTTTERVNALVDAALVARNRRQRPRDYLGGSRVGEACARKLAYEVAHAPKDPGRDFDGGILRVFDAGHQFEALSVRWLREAGFGLRDRGADGEQFGFSAAGGRLRGHADGVVVAGPDVGRKSWADLVKRGLRVSKPVYFAQVQLYMAYLELDAALLTALNRDTLALHHEAVPFEPAEAQRLSDRAVDVLLAVDAGELPPRVAAASDSHICRFCPYAVRCWEAAPA
jgi:hypothetical protein